MFVNMTYAKKGEEAYHERAEIECKVERLVCSSFMQKHHIGDDIGLNSLSRTSCDAIEHTCPHEATIGLSFSSPNGTAKANQKRGEINRSPAEGCAQRYPIIHQYPNHHIDIEPARRTR